MICTWEFAHLGLCGTGPIGRGPLTTLDIFLIFVVLLFPLLIAAQIGYTTGYRDASRNCENCPLIETEEANEGLHSL